jgi:lipopolysaccharide export system permease protein
MRASRTLAWYLAREILQYSTLGFAAVSVVLITQNLLRRMDDLTAVGFTAQDLLVVLRCLVPMLTSYAIPVALLFGSAIAIRRLVSDSEVLAMRACGLGVKTLLIPSLAIGAVVSGISAYLLISAEHEARQTLLRLFNSVGARGSLLRAGEFRGIGKRMIWVTDRDRDNRLEGIMISDNTLDDPFTIFAERGRYSLDEETALIHLELEDGELHMTDDSIDRYRRVLFEKFDYTIDVTWLLSGGANPRRPKQMSLSELRDVIARGRAGDPLRELAKRDPVLYELEIHRRFALPAAPLLFALAVVPLALRGAPNSRAWGPLLAITLAFAYYAVLTLFQYLARQGWLPPPLAFWIPNALVVAIALQQLRRTRIDG